jgi:hypothetical protein
MDQWHQVIEARFPDLDTTTRNTLCSITDFVRDPAHPQHHPDVEDAITAVAVSDTTPTGVLEVLATDPDAAVRALIALNPSTPVAVLDTLTGDSDEMVAENARHARSERQQ